MIKTPQNFVEGSSSIKLAKIMQTKTGVKFWVHFSFKLFWSRRVKFELGGACDKNVRNNILQQYWTNVIPGA